ncbi:MAG: hypothetical protein ACLSHC_09655 [Bilophila wadsworthia]
MAVRRRHTAGRAETDATVRGPVVLTPQLPVLVAGRRVRSRLPSPTT